MNTPGQIVATLLESDDLIGDHKDYAMAVYAHPVWDVSVQEFRGVLRSLGWKVTSAYRRKRGSICVNAVKPFQHSPVQVDTRDLDDQYSNRDKLQQQIEQWIKQKFPNDAEARQVAVHVWVHQPVRFGETWYASVELIKYDESGNGDHYG